MRKSLSQTALIAATSLGAMALGGAADAQTLQPAISHAVSADRYAIQADYQSPSRGLGYSWQARRAADCLATYRNYDPKTNLISVAPGIVRKCDL